MARILRRRVVQTPKVASGRRNLASEINQWLKLGLNAQQIIEKMIPDDPSVTPEMMDPVFDMMARRQGATAPLAERVDRAKRLVSGAPGQAPAIPVGQPSPEVPKSPSQGLGAPPRTPPGAAVPPKSEFFPTLGVDPEQQKFSDDFRSVRRSSMPTEEKIRFAATPGTSPEARREMVRQIALDIFGGAGRPTPGRGFDGAITANSLEDAMAQAEALVERAEMAQLEEQGSAEMQSGLQAMARAKAKTKAQAKAEVSQSIQEAQIAENAEQLKSSFRQMFNAIKEGSGMYDFADNVQRAVPLFLRAAQASKASSDDIQLFKLFARKAIREGEATARGAEFDRRLTAQEQKAGRLLTAGGAEYNRRKIAEGAEYNRRRADRTADNNRKFKRAQTEYDRRFDKQAGKDQLGYERRTRLKYFNALLKDDGLPVPARRAIERQMAARQDLAEAKAALGEAGKLFKDGQAGIDKALAEIKATGRAPSEYQESLEKYLPALINYSSAKAGVDELEKLVQEYAQTSGSFIPPLKALNAKVGAELKRAGAGSQSNIEKIRKAAEASGIVIPIGATPGASKPARTRTREEIKALGEQAGSVFPPN